MIANPTPCLPERRPIRTRDARLSHRLSGVLATRGVTANSISVAGMICGILAGIALAATQWTGWQTGAFIAGAALVQFRLLANMLDGMVAVGTGTASPLGELYNEIPDRVSDVATLIGAGFAAGGNPMLGALAACAAVLVAYVRAEGKVAGAHQEFCGPMAKPQRMFLVTLGALASAAAPSDWRVMTWLLGGLIAGSLWTALRRISRIADALKQSRP
jgi:phosphatidylglycerophosphate synthase